MTDQEKQKRIQEFYERLHTFLDEQTIKEIPNITWEISQIQVFPDRPKNPARLVFFFSVKKDK